jgi:predicted nucleotide-binding protein (sugar kinase/HSP70/actin superfamily)
MQTFPDGGRFYVGNRCERGAGKEKKQLFAPNIYKYKYERLFEYYKDTKNDECRGRIGIPRVLNMYEDYPFWHTFFTKLGYEVILSDKSSAELYYCGMTTIPSDSLCYPAKLVHGHIMNLIEKGAKKIFYPFLPYNMEDEFNPSDNHFNCPVVASYAENIYGNMDILVEKNIEFMRPFLPINDKKRMKKRLYDEFGKRENISARLINEAADAAYAEIESYRRDVRKKGMEIIKQAQENRQPLIILAGRPYHIDPEINHGIPELIQSYGLAVISEDAVYHMPVQSESLKIVNQWSYHARLYHAAHYAAEHENVTLIQLSSFGCGLDAITTGQVKEILEKHSRIYTMIKLDDVSNLGAARIRIRSLIAALARHKNEPYKKLASDERPHFTAECKKTHTIIAPQLSPIHFELIVPVLRAHGYNVVIPEIARPAVDVGLKYVNNDMCYPAIVVIGQIINALKSGKFDADHTSVMMFQTSGACRATNYMNILRQGIKEAGFPQVPVFACWGLETDSFEISRAMMIEIIKAVIYGDLLMSVRNRTAPYEIERGSSDRLYQKWMDFLKQEFAQNTGFRHFAINIKSIVRDFENLPIHEEMEKPKVGIVGEILAKYHPLANNNIEKVLQEEGAEVVMPNFTDFFMYLAYDSVVKYDLLDGALKNKLLSKAFIQLIEIYRSPVKRAMKKSRRFTPPHTIKEIAKLASRHVSLGNMAGEGWFLTGEMVRLLEDGVPNIVCLQPFGCLPNHITGKGVIHELRRHYKSANILAIDCDAGMSEVNQLNRLKLMLSVAKEKCKQTSSIAKI